MVRNIGVTVTPPEKKCDNIYCPFHGKLRIRGRLFSGKVLSAKLPLTALVRWDRLYYLPKYGRYEKRRTKVFAHNPPCISAKEGDAVLIGECRPLSKAKRFVIIEKK